MTTLRASIDEHATGDLAERVGSAPLPAATAASFDQRSPKELQEVAADHDSAMERERALWELGHRGDSGMLLLDRFSQEPSPAVRWNLLWLLTRLQTDDIASALSLAARDDSPEVRDWAGVFAEERGAAKPQPAYPQAVYTSDGSFDQTVPLEIAGYADVFLGDGTLVRAHLSPMWFNEIMGRVLAAINVDTFMTDLVIEKELRDYNPDGSHHYEPFYFRGASFGLAPSITQHIYESSAPRPFYPSGRLKESDPVEVNVTLARQAVTQRVTAEQMDVVAEDGESQRGAALREFGVVRSVRGQFSGWAFTDLERFGAAGRVEPGTVQLTSPTDPLVGERTNTLLHGTFRGKLADHDGDGRYDINLVPCHATITGELDLDCDGEPDVDPYTMGAVL